MNTNRDCGCKSFRSCKICEDKFGIDRDLTAESKLKQLDKCYEYHPESNSLMLDQVEISEYNLSGVKLIKDFVTEAEEARLVSDLDNIPWDASVSGRRKQNFGPRANFKGRKAKCGNFSGFPAVTEFIQRRFDTVPRLEGYRTVEQCSIEYTPATGASIEPHIDDCWIWGERIVQLNLLSDSVLTFFPYHPTDAKKYNLSDLKDFQRILSDSGDSVLFNPFREESKNSKEPYLLGSNTQKQVRDAATRVPLPRRSLLILHGEARYEWEHCVLRQDIKSRRVVIAYREFTPPFLPGGDQYEKVGKEVLEKAEKFFPT